MRLLLIYFFGAFALRYLLTKFYALKKTDSAVNFYAMLWPIYLSIIIICFFLTVISWAVVKIISSLKKDG